MKIEKKQSEVFTPSFQERIATRFQEPLTIWQTQTKITKSILVITVFLVLLIVSLFGYYLNKTLLDEVKTESKIKQDPKKALTLNRYKSLEGIVTAVEGDLVTFTSSEKNYTINTSLINEYLGTVTKAKGDAIQSTSVIKIGDQIKANLDADGRIISAAVVIKTDVK